MTICLVASSAFSGHVPRLKFGRHSGQTQDLLDTRWGCRAHSIYCGAERLEARLVLSVFYDLSVIAAVGDTTTTGETIDSIDPFVSINDNGRVAFTANVSGPTGAGSALVVDDGARRPLS